GDTSSSAAISSPVLPSAANSSARRSLRTMSSAECRLRPAMCFIVPSSPTSGHRTLKPRGLNHWEHATAIAILVGGRVCSRRLSANQGDNARTWVVAGLLAVCGGGGVVGSARADQFDFIMQLV